MGVSWIYKLKKAELIELLEKAQLDSTGNTVDLRQRYIEYVRQHPELHELREDPEGYDEERDKTRDELIVSLVEAGEAVTEPTAPLGGDNENEDLQDTPRREGLVRRVIHSTPIMDTVNSSTLDRMRKWGLHYEGRDPYSFLERIDELQHAYQLTDEQMLRGFPELLKGDALLWYRNEIQSVRNYRDLITSFRQYYLSTRELRNLETTISLKKQGNNEDFRKFSSALRTLMRRHGGYDLVREIDMLYWNMLPKFRLHIHRTGIENVNDLLQRVSGIEEILKEIDNNDKLKVNKKIVCEVNAKYNFKTDCWNCGQTGHRKLECENEKLKFCSFCGKKGTWSKFCKCVKPGNSKKTESKE